MTPLGDQMASVSVLSPMLSTAQTAVHAPSITPQLPQIKLHWEGLQDTDEAKQFRVWRHKFEVPAGPRHGPTTQVYVQIIPSKLLKLIREIGSGPGYFLHAGRNQGHAAIIKVFNRGPNVRQQLESTVAFSKEVMCVQQQAPVNTKVHKSRLRHPNLLRIEGFSSPASLIQFIAYEDVHWKNAEGPLAAALKNDLRKSIRLGFKMAGLNHLSVQGVSLGSMRVERQNFDIFLDIDDRFVISVHPRSLEEGKTAEFQEPEDNAWIVFNALCQKILLSANHVLHHEQIDRDPAVLDVVRSSSVAESSAVASLLSFGSTVASQSIQGEAPVPPRREYVWRTMNRGQQSLATVARRIALDLDMNLSTIRLLTQSDGQNPHRCPGMLGIGSGVPKNILEL
ncbi:hypothetical protein C8R44DRAFT_755183 [Mycena epipterygia]|nr:hypothetical protein C8R44DRAFT_755183 [Mycena epipterygia]